MRLTFAVDGIKETQAQLRGFSDRRLAASLATGLTRTAVEAKAGLQAEMPNVFDRPTPYTIGGVGMKGATAQTLEAEVFIKDQQSGDRGGRPAAVYLRPEIKGGKRQAKGVERLLTAAGALPGGWAIVPGAGAQLDQHGNLSRQQLTLILRQIRRSRSAGPQPRRRLVGDQRKAGGQVFVIHPGAKGAAPGVYIRDAVGRNITPLLLFVRQATYRARFDFEGIVTRIATQRLAPNIERAIGESAARLLQRGGQ